MVPNSNDSRLEGTFDYSQSGIGRLGASMIFSAVMWLALIVFMFNGLLHVIHQPNSKGSIWPFALVLFLFFLIGIALLVAGISYLMAYRNERISIHGDEVQWTNRAGVVCLRFTLNQVTDVQEKTLSQPSVGYQSYRAPMHHRCVVQTNAGNMAFSDEIAHYDRLMAFFISKDRTPPKIGTFRYRSPVIFAVAAFVFPLTGFMIYEAVLSYFNGSMMKMNGVYEKTPVYLPLFVIGISSVFYVVIGYGTLNYLNERIIINGERLQYYNIFGSKTVDVPLSFVEKGSFMKGPGASRGTFKYSVQTTQGKVSWSDSITNCTDLVEQLSGASRSSSLGEPLQEP